MNRIVISGYYGFNNIGDEAVLFSILKGFSKKLEAVDFVVLSNNPEQTTKLYGVSAKNRWKLGEIWKALRGADLLISGGGSLLQDVTSPKSVLYYLGVVTLAKLMGKKVVYYTQGIGPLNSNLGQKAVAFISKYVDLIIVRDVESKQLLEAIGLKKPAIYVAADTVFGMEPLEINPSKGRELLARSGLALGEKEIVGISVRAWQEYQGFYKVLAGEADKLIREGKQVVFLPFHFPEDLHACRAVKDLMEEEPFIIKEQCTVEEMFGVLGELQLVIGMRLHSLIMATVMGVPSIGLSYDPKVDNILKMMEMPNAGRIETLDKDILDDIVEEVLGNYDSYQEEIKKSGAILRGEALKAVELVHKLL